MQYSFIGYQELCSLCFLLFNQIVVATNGHAVPVAPSWFTYNAFASGEAPPATSACSGIGNK